MEAVLGNIGIFLHSQASVCSRINYIRGKGGEVDPQVDYLRIAHSKKTSLFPKRLPFLTEATSRILTPHFFMGHFTPHSSVEHLTRFSSNGHLLCKLSCKPCQQTPILRLSHMFSAHIKKMRKGKIYIKSKFWLHMFLERWRIENCILGGLPFQMNVKRAV